MSPKQLVSSYMQAVWVERRLDTLGAFVAPDLIQHNPDLPDGRAPLKAFLETLFNTLMPDLEWRVARTIAEEALVVVHNHAIPAPGTRGMVVVDIFRVENDKIVEHWDVTHEVAETSVSGRSVF